MDFGLGFPIPEPIVYLIVIALVVWYAFGRKKKLERLEREDKRLSYEISVERKKKELAKLKEKEGGK